jgi:hypothetical protein
MKRLLPVTLLAACVGHLQPERATFQGIPRPIMLSGVDRIGGGAPAPARRVAGFDGEAVSLVAHSESRTETATTVTTTTTDTTLVNNVDLYNAAIEALQPGPDLAIVITKLRPWARGYISFIKNTVMIEGDVVVVGGGR